MGFRRFVFNSFFLILCSDLCCQLNIFFFYWNFITTSLIYFSYIRNFDRFQSNYKNVILGTARKTRIIDVVYNASNNELVRTKTLVKNAIIVIDATPFRQWYEAHYILPLGRKRETKQGDKIEEEDVFTKKRSARTMKKYVARQKYAKVEPALEEQFSSGRVLGKLILYNKCTCIKYFKVMSKSKAIHNSALILILR